MSCKYEKYIDSYLDGDLNEHTMKKFSEHLKDCSSCSNKVSETINFNNSFISAISEYQFESRENLIISKAQSMKKKFNISLMLYSAGKYILPTTAILILCCFVYYFKPIYKNVSASFFNFYGIEQSLISGNKKIEINDADLNDIISNYLTIRKSSANSNEKTFEAHKVYGTEQKDDELYVYMYSFTGTFWRNNTTKKSLPTQLSRFSSPALLIIKKKNSEYIVSNYIEPIQGESAESFIKKEFPNKYIATAIYDSKNTKDMEKQITYKANAWESFIYLDK